MSRRGGWSGFTARLAALVGGLSAALLAIMLAVGVNLPRGGQIVYTSLHFGRSDIYLLDADRALAHNLTPGINTSTLPTWSPDGGRIAFIRMRDGDTYLYMMDADGRHLQPLARERTANGLPIWSPDGTRIAFRSHVNGSPKIVVLELDTGQSHVVNPTSAADSSPLWSPDGRWLMFLSYRDGNPRVYALDPDCYRTERGCRSSDDLLLRGASVGWPPSWSPDGRQLAYTVLTRGDADLYVIGVRCTDDVQTCVHDRRALTDNDHADYSPVWSPDGSQIAFISNPDGQYDLYLLTLAGGDVRRLTRLGVRGQTPVWSPDGRFIAFEHGRDGHTDVYVVEVSGGVVRRLTGDGMTNTLLSWRP